MSGIAALVAGRGEPDRGILDAMVDAMSGRGPDARGTVADGPATLGCAHLRSTPESAAETLPLALEDRAWIVGDLRIDDRARLRRELEGAGRRPAEGASDAALVLESWAAWGEGCVDHLLGDYAFAIWDRRERTLFAARDPWGIKPLFVARPPDGGLALASDLTALRLHPDVSDRLDDRAIADFLLFGHYLDGDMTAFADVRRLPPAHALTWRGGETRVWRHWELPVEEPFRDGRAESYVEPLMELLGEAVADRLRAEKVGIRMSGGIDSTALAVVARRVGGPDLELHAYTSVFESLMPDEEGRYAAMVAERLGMPHHRHVEDAFPPLGGGRPPEVLEPEPEDSLHTGSESAKLAEELGHGVRALLSGVGGDETTRAPRSYAAWALRRRAFGRLLADVGTHALRHRRPPPLGIRTALHDRRALPGGGWPFPRWIRPDLVERLDLHERWRRAVAPRPRVHPEHPESYGMLTAPLFSQTLEATDPGRRGFPLEIRYPFLDLRLVRFLLKLPVRYEWMQKGLLREAMRGALPEAVRTRPKSPLAGDLLSAWLNREKNTWLSGTTRSKRLSRYVHGDGISSLAHREDFRILWSDFRALALDRWLHSHERGGQTL